MNSTSRTIDNVPASGRDASASGGGVSGPILDAIQAVDATQTRDIFSNANRIAANTTDIATNATGLSAEVTRATGIEAAIVAVNVTQTANIARNTTNLSAEVTRANGVEVAIDARVTTQAANIATNVTNIAAETSRATSAETVLKSSIEGQVSRQIFDNTVLQSAISDEAARANSVEITIATKVTALNARLVTEETAMMNMLGFISTNAIESTGATLTLGGSSTTQTINMGTSNAAQLINIGTGSTAKTINLGSSADTVVISGTTVTTTTNNLVLTDKQIVLNKNGPAGSGSNSGIQIEEGGAITGYIQQNANRDGFDLQPSNATLIKLNQSLLKSDSPNFATVNANLNAVTATATIVNATTVNATNITASGVISTATLNTTDINATGVINGNFSGNIGGVSAADIASTVAKVQAASTSNSNNTIVVRDPSGRIRGQRLEAVDVVVSNYMATNMVQAATKDLVLRGIDLLVDTVVAASPFVAQTSVTVGSNILAPNAIISLDNKAIRTKVIALWDEGVTTDSSQHNFSGFGMGGGTLRYQTCNTSTAHRFYAAINATTSRQLLAINPDGSMDVTGQVRTPSVSNTNQLDLNMTGGVYGGTNLSLQNRGGCNGMVLTQAGTGEDLCTINMTTNSASRGGRVAGIISENRQGSMFRNSQAFGGEIQLYTDTNAATRVATFGVSGSSIVTDVIVNNLYTTGVSNGAPGNGGTVNTSFLNFNNAPISQSCNAGTGASTVGVPAIAATMLTIRVNGKDYKIPLFFP